MTRCVVWQACLCLALLLSDVQVIDRIMNDVLPVIRQSGLAGHAEYVTRSIFFTENPIAIDMLVDILTDRCDNGVGCSTNALHCMMAEGLWSEHGHLVVLMAALV